MCDCKPGAGCVSCQPMDVWYPPTPAWEHLVKQRILDELEDLILRCKHEYYCVGKPLVNDDQYDGYEERLRAQRPDSWVLDAVGCPLCYGRVDEVSSDEVAP